MLAADVSHVVCRLQAVGGAAVEKEDALPDVLRGTGGAGWRADGGVNACDCRRRLVHRGR